MPRPTLLWVRYGAGATLILQEKFSLSTFWDQARENEATEFNSIGAMLMLMYKHSLEPRSDHLVKIAYSAPALPEAIRGEIERRFHLKVVFGYGLSESTFGFIEPMDGPRKPGSMGKIRSYPGFPNKAIVADEEDQELPTGSKGQILLQNAAVMNGYYRDDQRTSETLRNGFLHTGDLGYVDADGYYFFVDRSSDVIRRKGENISSSEIESVILSHPEVTECAVLGVPSELSDDEIVAFVVAKTGSNISGDDDQGVVWGTISPVQNSRQSFPGGVITKRCDLQDKQEGTQKGCLGATEDILIRDIIMKN